MNTQKQKIQQKIFNIKHAKAIKVGKIFLEFLKYFIIGVIGIWLATVIIKYINSVSYLAILVAWEYGKR